MFTEIATEDVLKVVRAHDFESESKLGFGSQRIDAIVALERLNRATQAEMVAQIAALRRPIRAHGHRSRRPNAVGHR